MELKAGTRLRSSVCSTEVIVVRTRGDDVDLRCGGAPMVTLDGQTMTEPIAPEHSSGTALGKRYVDEGASLEMLCTKAGAGSLSIGDLALTLKDAKPLPSSD